MSLRLDPLGFAGPCLDKTRVGVLAGQWLLTTWAGALHRLLSGGSRLPGQTLVEHLLGEDLAEGQEQVFDLGQACAPGRAVGAVEFIDEVFGDALDIGADFFHLGGAFFGSWHLRFLHELVSRT
jgi:hypothetical protein